MYAKMSISAVNASDSNESPNEDKKNDKILLIFA